MGDRKGASREHAGVPAQALACSISQNEKKAAPKERLLIKYAARRLNLTA